MPAAVMAYAANAFLIMPILSGFASITRTCSMMMPMNPLIPARAAIPTL